MNIPTRPKIRKWIIKMNQTENELSAPNFSVVILWIFVGPINANLSSNEITTRINA